MERHARHIVDAQQTRSRWHGDYRNQRKCPRPSTPQLTEPFLQARCLCYKTVTIGPISQRWKLRLREPSQGPTARHQQSRHLNPGPGIQTTCFSTSAPSHLPVRSFPWERFLAMAWGQPQPHNNAIAHHTRPRAQGDGIAHVTQPQSQRELCALCPRPASPALRSPPNWRRSREPDESKTWGERRNRWPLKWGKSNRDSSPGLGCKKFVQLQ